MSYLTKNYITALEINSLLRILSESSSRMKFIIPCNLEKIHKLNRGIIE